jgi:alpha-beta hydrolase superfamily lysophospholipase
MAISFIEETLNLNEASVHVYKWTNAMIEPRSIVVLIHGLMMHGKAFDYLASHLAAQGCIVVAPDLRGFGRFYFSSDNDEKGKIDYQKSLEDLSNILKALKAEYPALPLFCAGESLGTHLARHIATIHPQDVVGLILSSPCMRPKMVSVPLIPHTLTQLLLTGLDPEAEFNLLPFAERFLKDEPESLKSYLNDPMTRKSLEILELIDSIRIVGSIESQSISPHIPILVLRGKKDCVCENASMAKFLDTLKTDNMTVHPCTDCGHLILQSPNVDSAILDKICSWIESSAGAFDQYSRS